MISGGGVGWGCLIKSTSPTGNPVFELVSIRRRRPPLSLPITHQTAWQCFPCRSILVYTQWI
eukprot:4224674-Ditylum_brightwellii.AAC.1